MRPPIILLFGVIASFLTAFTVYRAVQQPAPVAAVASPVGVTPVVVAATDLPFGTVLDARHLRAIEWPAGSMPPNAYAAPETLIGRVTMAHMVNNEPVTNDKLAPVGSKGLLPLVIEQGMRAVTVKVNEVTAVGGFIVPGSRVDVLITADVKMPAEVPTGRNGQSDVQSVSAHRTRTLLQNVTVLALGQVLESNDPKPPGNLSTATLLVTPEQTEMLALAASEGSLQLALRNFADNDQLSSQGKATEDLFGAPVRPTHDVPTDQVEFIRGAERVVLAF